MSQNAGRRRLELSEPCRTLTPRLLSDGQRTGDFRPFSPRVIAAIIPAAIKAGPS